MKCEQCKNGFTDDVEYMWVSWHKLFAFFVYLKTEGEISDETFETYLDSLMDFKRLIYTKYGAMFPDPAEKEEE